MGYTISYISTANPNLSFEDVINLFEKVTTFNNSQNIKGILIYSEGAFFQFIEAEKRKITELYSKIEKDPCHKNVIKFIEKPISKPAYSSFICDVVTENSIHNETKLKNYLRPIEALYPTSPNAVERVIKTIFMQFLLC